MHPNVTFCAAAAITIFKAANAQLTTFPKIGTVTGIGISAGTGISTPSGRYNESSIILLTSSARPSFPTAKALHTIALGATDPVGTTGVHMNHAIAPRALNRPGRPTNIPIGVFPARCFGSSTGSISSTRSVTSISGLAEESTTDSVPSTFTGLSKPSSDLFHLEAVSIGIRRRQSVSAQSYWAGNDGFLTTDCIASAAFVLRDEQYYNSLGGQIAASSTVNSTVFKVSAEKDITRSFTSDATLNWSNTRFSNGSARFLALTSGEILAGFTGASLSSDRKHLAPRLCPGTHSNVTRKSMNQTGATISTAIRTLELAAQTNPSLLISTIVEYASDCSASHAMSSICTSCTSARINPSTFAIVATREALASEVSADHRSRAVAMAAPAASTSFLAASSPSAVEGRIGGCHLVVVSDWVCCVLCGIGPELLVSSQNPLLFR